MKCGTGGRVKRLGPYLGGSTFMLTWGDGVSDVDLSKLLRFHREHGKLATVIAVRPPARSGHMVFDGERVSRFEADGRRLDQRRLLRAGAGGDRVHRRRRNDVRAWSDGALSERRPAYGLQAYGLLGVHGYVAR
jgi:hypothetical protein